MAKKQINDLANARKKYFNLVKEEIKLSKKVNELQKDKAKEASEIERLVAVVSGVKKPDFSSMIEVPKGVKLKE